MPSSPTPTSVTAVNLRRRDQMRCGFGATRARVEGLSTGVERPESRVKEKTSPREERATKVLPHEAILRIEGLAPTFVSIVQREDQLRLKRRECESFNPPEADDRPASCSGRA